jgi:hypothetical protein
MLIDFLGEGKQDRQQNLRSLRAERSLVLRLLQREMEFLQFNDRPTDDRADTA